MNHLTAIKIPADRPWLPPSIRHQALKGEVPIEVKFSHAERRVYRKRKRVPVSVWAENHRMLTMSSLPGKWRNSTTPYLAGIMDAAIAPGVEEVVICKAPQVGVSEAAHNFIGWCIDRAPGPVMYVYPDELTADENSRDRIVPMIMSSPRLRSYLTGAQDDSGLKRINLAHMPIYLAWARSASRLGNKPIRYLILDEVDKYPATAGKKESDPISLAEKRTTTYKWQRKIWKISTPTDENGAIVKAIGLCAVVFVFEVCCPLCGGAQVMNFDNIIWPKDERDPNQIEMNRLANYKCKHCEELWNDDDRNRAVGTGSWICKDTSRPLEAVLRTRPKRIGFHLPAWLSRFVSLSETAASFLRGLKDPIKMRDFCNAHKAEPWVHHQVEGNIDRVLALRDDRPRNLVPTGTAGLLLAVDTQQEAFYYELRAFKYGKSLDSALVREGYVQHFADIERIMYEEEFFDSAGTLYKVQSVFIDSGGTRAAGKKHSRTAEVYAWCKANPMAKPIKGTDRQNQPWRVTTLDTFPNSNKAIPGGLKLFTLNVTHYKDELARRLEIAPDDPGAWKFHSAVDENFAQHYCSEYRDDNGLWQHDRNKGRNDFFDCGVYNLAQADCLQVVQWPDTSKKKTAAKRRIISKGVQR